jgi:Flp pilus assembly protein TadD
MRSKRSGPVESRAPSDPPRRGRSRCRWFVCGALLTLLAAGGGIWADWWFCLPDHVQATYVGRASCVECHRKEVEEWLGSDHERAMDLATEETVLGDFNNVEFTRHGITSRLFRDGEKFMIHTEGPDGEMADFEVRYVFGIRPLQQYMVEFDRPADMPEHEIARLQVLRISWDTESGEWIDVPPPDADERLSPDDPLHWTGVAQNWNNMCAYCHSTDLQKNFDVSTLTYHTTFSEINVSCEACHGPASLHVQLAESRSLFWDRKRGYGLVELKTDDTRTQIHSCAPCHSRRRVIYPDFRPGDDYYDCFHNELLDEATYYADGQIMDENYVFGSFIQSKMYHQDIRCTDCHNPHSLQLKHEGNKVCTACHQHSAAKYDTPAHHFHQSDSTGAACAECHMPETTYMEVDPRRDHSIHIPRPDLSVALGTPNACTRCHLSDARISDEKRATLAQYRDWIDAARAGDEEIRAELARLDQWMLDSVREWYQKDSWGDHFAFALEAGRRAEAGAEQRLADVARDRKLPGIARASAIRHRGLLRSAGDYEVEIAALRDDDPQVRWAAIGRLQDLLPLVGGRPLDRQEQQRLVEMVSPTVRHLAPLLDDPRRVVRAEAGRVLARLSAAVAAQLLNATQRQQLDRAIDEYIAGVLESNDRGGAHMELGVLYESMGRDALAEQAYRTAIRVEPGMTGPRSNLAALLDRRLEEEVRRASGGPPTPRIAELQHELAELRGRETELLARDARLLPGSAGLQYRYGLALYLTGDHGAAEQALREACRLDPENDEFLQALVLFLDRHERYDEALQGAERLLEMRPRDPQYRRIQESIEHKLRVGRSAPARDTANTGKETER